MPTYRVLSSRLGQLHRYEAEDDVVAVARGRTIARGEQLSGDSLTVERQEGVDWARVSTWTPRSTAL